MKIRQSVIVPASLTSVVQKFDEKLFVALTPPWQKMNLKRFDAIKLGAEVHLDLIFGPKTYPWVSLIVKFESRPFQEYMFIDVGKTLPPFLSSWHHLHQLRALDEHTTEIIDEIDFAGRFAPLDIVLYLGIKAMLIYRKMVYPQYFTAS